MIRIWLLAFVLSTGAIAQDAVSILRENCFACHGAALKMSNLDLRTRESMLTGGEHGAALVPGNPDKSRLYRFIAGLENPAMPPGKPLAKDKVEAIRKWIEAGAPMAGAAPANHDASAALSKMEERPITRRRAELLGIRPAGPSHPVPPTARRTPSTLSSATR